MDPQAKDIMNQPAISVDKDVDLEEVIHVMQKNNVSKLTVIEKGNLVGVLTDGAIADELGALKNKNLQTARLHASSVMTREYPTATPTDPLGHIRNLFAGTDLGLIPVTHGSEVLGVITKADLLAYVDSGDPVTKVMAQTVHSVLPDDRIIHARRLMIDNGVERLPVVEDGQVVGILAEMDVAMAFETMKRRVDTNHHAQHLKNLLVRDAMNAPVVTIHQSASQKEAARRMIDEDVGCLPVLDDDDVIQGLVTRTDLIGTNGPGSLPRPDIPEVEHEPVQQKDPKRGMGSGGPGGSRPDIRHK